MAAKTKKDLLIVGAPAKALVATRRLLCVGMLV